MREKISLSVEMKCLNSVKIKMKFGFKSSFKIKLKESQKGFLKEYNVKPSKGEKKDEIDFIIITDGKANSGSNYQFCCSSTMVQSEKLADFMGRLKSVGLLEMRFKSL